MPDSSNGMRTEPLAETVAHFVLHVAVVCARRTELVQYTSVRQRNLTLSQARILFKPDCFFFLCFSVFFLVGFWLFFFTRKPTGFFSNCILAGGRVRFPVARECAVTNPPHTLVAAATCRTHRETYYLALSGQKCAE